MTTTEPAKPTTAANSTTKADANAKPYAEMVTLDQLAREMKMPPRDARMLLRLAAKQNCASLSTLPPVKCGEVDH